MKHKTLIILSGVAMALIMVLGVIYQLTFAAGKKVTTPTVASTSAQKSATSSSQVTTSSTTAGELAISTDELPEDPELAEKYAAVQTYLDNADFVGTVNVAVLSLTSNNAASLNGDVIMTAASTGKLPALYYTQRRLNEGTLQASDEFIYTAAINAMSQAFQSDGAGSLQYAEEGTSYTIAEIMQLTAQESDNQGANFLAYYACNQYDATMQSTISKIIGRNWTDRSQMSAHDNALMMQAIYEEGGSLVEYLKATDYDGERIDKYLPVAVAHKIGDLDAWRHDVAIVYADKPYVLSVMTENSDYETIAELSEQIYELLK